MFSGEMETITCIFNRMVTLQQGNQILYIKSISNYFRSYIHDGGFFLKHCHPLGCGSGTKGPMIERDIRSIHIIL